MKKSTKSNSLSCSKKIYLKNLLNNELKKPENENIKDDTNTNRKSAFSSYQHFNSKIRRNKHNSFNYEFSNSQTTERNKTKLSNIKSDEKNTVRLSNIDKSKN